MTTTVTLHRPVPPRRLRDGEHAHTIPLAAGRTAAYLLTVQNGQPTYLNYDGQTINPTSTCFGAYVLRTLSAMGAQL